VLLLAWLLTWPHLSDALSSPGGQHPLCGVADDIIADEAAWQTYYEREAPETAPLPNGYSSKLSQFEVLLLLRCLRVDRVTVAITHFVMATLGERFVTPPVLDYNVIFKQSSETTPVVFVLSPGADPAFDVFRCVVWAVTCFGGLLQLAQRHCLCQLHSITWGCHTGQSCAPCYCCCVTVFNT
jgi:hypothetical protein